MLKEAGTEMSRCFLNKKKNCNISAFYFSKFQQCCNNNNKKWIKECRPFLSLTCFPLPFIRCSLNVLRETPTVLGIPEPSLSIQLFWTQIYNKCMTLFMIWPKELTPMNHEDLLYLDFLNFFIFFYCCMLFILQYVQKMTHHANCMMSWIFP